MGVFMEPVFDELVRAWDEGVWTYDRATKTTLKNARLVPLLPPRPIAAATPVSMKVFYFRLCFACMASTLLD